MLNKYERAVKTFQKNGASFAPDPLPTAVLGTSEDSTVASIRGLYNDLVENLAAAGIVEIVEPEP